LILGSITSNTALSISLSAKPVPAPAREGVWVRGRVNNAGQQQVYISGVPGTLYTDGTFEFRGVPPGRHVVVMFGSSLSSRQRGAVITVRNRDVDDIELQDTITLPEDILTETPIIEASLSAGSSASALHAIRGHVVEAATQHPIAGIVTLRGYMRSLTNSLPADGEFEIQNLLPGRYNLKIETFDAATLTQSIVIGNEDVDLKLTVP
jgi:hypothetical protein